eukprot:COSAG01_NODE_11526_length_1914_cov_1.950413_2_plen_188_part_00
MWREPILIGLRAPKLLAGCLCHRPPRCVPRCPGGCPAVLTVACCRMEGTLPLVAAAIAGAGAASACAAVRAGNFSSSSATSRWQATPTGAGAGRVVGLLHPGSMGASIGYNLRMNGARVLWASEGRSADSRARAEAQGLEDAGSIDELVAQASVPPAGCYTHLSTAFHPLGTFRGGAWRLTTSACRR